VARPGGTGDEAVVLKPVEQSRHRRHDVDHASADLHARHRSAFAPEYAEYVVLRPGEAEGRKGFPSRFRIWSLVRTMLGIASFPGDSNGFFLPSSWGPNESSDPFRRMSS
jgi:hypothetical protein